MFLWIFIDNCIETDALYLFGLCYEMLIPFLGPHVPDNQMSSFTKFDKDLFVTVASISQ